MTTDLKGVYASAIQECPWCDDTQTILKGRFGTLGLFAWRARPR